jgi:hypothetical protein
MPETEVIACSNLHRVHWQECFVADGGRRLICHFHAPDAEAVRVAFRGTDADADAIWPGTVHDRTELARADVTIALNFLPPLPADTESALEVVETECLTLYGLKLARAVISCDRRRVICVCEAPG